VGVFCANETVYPSVGTGLLLVCNISIPDSNIIYPTWWGPPNLTKYNAIFGQFNPNLGEKINRINWTENKIDLKLVSVTFKDAGLYKCEALFQEKTYSYEIGVTVKGKFKYISKLEMFLLKILFFLPSLIGASE